MRDSQNSPPAQKKGFMGLTLHMTAGRWLMVGVGGICLLTAFGVIWLESRNNSADTGANVDVQAANGIHNAPGKSSPAYAKEVEAYNKKHAEEALEKNQSFVGIPVTSVTSVSIPKQAPAAANTAGTAAGRPGFGLGHFQGVRRHRRGSEKRAGHQSGVLHSALSSAKSGSFGRVRWAAGYVRYDFRTDGHPRHSPRIHHLRGVRECHEKHDARAGGGRVASGAVQRGSGHWQLFPIERRRFPVDPLPHAGASQRKNGFHRWVCCFSEDDAARHGQ